MTRAEHEAIMRGRLCPLCGMGKLLRFGRYAFCAAPTCGHGWRGDELRTRRRSNRHHGRFRRAVVDIRRHFFHGVPPELGRLWLWVPVRPT